MAWYKSISLKIILSIVGIVVAVNGIQAYQSLTVVEKQLNDMVLKTASQLSETIKKSIQSDMLLNRKEHAYKIMETIGRQEGIEKVRIYSKEGRILFSSDHREIEGMVDKRAEACYGCHAEARPLERLATSERSRIFHSTDAYELGGKGHRILGIISPLYNEKGCSSAACHAHPQSNKVLGVIDVTMSLADVDHEINASRKRILLSSVVSIVSICLIVAFILIRLIEMPVKELVLGTKRVSEGDLEHFISVTTSDEMGHLASSFNQMTGDLQKAREEIQEGIRNLELKVEERTQELKATQSQLLQSEKLAAVGKLAATVAHEINNPLTGVYTYIKLMERKIEQGQTGAGDFEKYRGFLETMRREVERTTAIVQNLLDFTRPKEPIRKQLNLLKVVEESLSLIRNKLSLNNVEVVNVMKPLPDILADPAHMKQVFINLMINACEAMERGGTLTISGDHNAEENTVTVGVRDTGVGIEVENLARIFDPFFSTKEKGTGLGLSVVNGIVARHNGKVLIDSSPGNGTNIRITLPIT
jgi:two-component system NtrC family sensor kinase